MLEVASRPIGWSTLSRIENGNSDWRRKPTARMQTGDVCNYYDAIPSGALMKPSIFSSTSAFPFQTI
jgi:hypothetical protein